MTGGRLDVRVGTSITERLVAALTATWRAIGDRHPDVPDVVLALGSGAPRGGHPGPFRRRPLARRRAAAGEADRAADHRLAHLRSAAAAGAQHRREDLRSGRLRLRRRAGVLPDVGTAGSRKETSRPLPQPGLAALTDPDPPAPTALRTAARNYQRAFDQLTQEAGNGSTPWGVTRRRTRNPVMPSAGQPAHLGHQHCV